MSPTASTEDPNFKELKRHPQFYIPSADLTFHIGDVLLRVHRYFFDRESRVFREQVLPAPAGGSPHGYTDSTSIALRVPLEDFTKFLGVFYNPTYSLYSHTIRDWITILSLAHKWEFTEVKHLAIRELEKYDHDTPGFGLVPRIALYEAYAVGPAVLVPLYAALCVREEPPSDEEAEKLGMRTVVRVYRAREGLRKAEAGPGMEKDSEGVYRVVGEVFGVEVPAVSTGDDKTDSWGGSKKKKGKK